MDEALRRASTGKPFRGLMNIDERTKIEALLLRRSFARIGLEPDVHDGRDSTSTYER